jgi:hypothetical protein
MAQAAHAPVTGAPYSAVRTTQMQRVLADGNHISRTMQAKVYRDNQGRTRTERIITPPAASGKQPFTEIVITDPVAGNRYVLNSATMMGRQMTLPTGGGTMKPSGSAMRGAEAGNIQTSTASLGTQTINSVAATGTQTTRTIAAGAIGNAQPITIVRTKWVSTDLKVPVEMKSSDPRFGTTDMELTNISRATPDASLFTVPAGYTVTPGGFGRGSGSFRGRHQ